MPLSIVAGTTTKASDASSVNPLSVTLRQTPTAGNLLVVGIVMGNSDNSAYTVTDNQAGGGNTYTRVDATSDVRVMLFYAKNIIASGTFIVSLNKNAGVSQTYKSIIVYEVAGADTTTPFVNGEVAYHAAQTSDGSTGAAPLNVSVTNSNPNSIFFSVLSDASAGNNPATVTPGSGWSIDATNAKVVDGTQFEVGGMDYKIVSASASTTQTWTLNTSDTYNCLIADFQQLISNQAQPTSLLLTGVGS